MRSITKKIQLFLVKTLSGQKPSKEQVGKAGEEAIALYVKQLGWKILARNWRPEGAYHGLELDIIAKKHDTLIFIEVKTRIFSQAQQRKKAFQKNSYSQIDYEKQQDFSCDVPETSPFDITETSPLFVSKGKEYRKQEHIPTVVSREKEYKKQEYIPAYASFTKKKQQCILQAAKHYLASTKMWECPCQFDLFCVQEESNGEFGIEHYEHVIEIGQTLDSSHSHWEPW